MSLSHFDIPVLFAGFYPLLPFFHRWNIYFYSWPLFEQGPITLPIRELRVTKEPTNGRPGEKAYGIFDTSQESNMDEHKVWHPGCDSLGPTEQGSPGRNGCWPTERSITQRRPWAAINLTEPGTNSVSCLSRGTGPPPRNKGTVFLDSSAEHLEAPNITGKHSSHRLSLSPITSSSEARDSTIDLRPGRLFSGQNAGSSAPQGSITLRGSVRGFMPRSCLSGKYEAGAKRQEATRLA